MKVKPTHYWLITDTHFNHDAIIKLCDRPENFKELIIENWAKAVKPDDVTIHLGDVIFSRPGELTELLAQVPGRKVLVKGNHDSKNNGWYMRHGFDFVCDALQLGEVYLTHIPQYVMKMPEGALYNVHGHLHNTYHHREFFRANSSANVIYGDHNILLALEHTDYQPVLLNEFVGKHKMLLNEKLTKERSEA